MKYIISTNLFYTRIQRLTCLFVTQDDGFLNINVEIIHILIKLIIGEIRLGTVIRKCEKSFHDQKEFPEIPGVLGELFGRVLFEESFVEEEELGLDFRLSEEQRELVEMGQHVRPHRQNVTLHQSFDFVFEEFDIVVVFEDFLDLWNYKMRGKERVDEGGDYLS